MDARTEHGRGRQFPLPLAVEPSTTSMKEPSITSMEPSITYFYGSFYCFHLLLWKLPLLPSTTMEASIQKAGKVCDPARVQDTVNKEINGKGRLYSCRVRLVPAVLEQRRHDPERSRAAVLTNAKIVVRHLSDRNSAAKKCKTPLLPIENSRT